MIRPADNGWHGREWAAEFLGTALLMFLVVTAKYCCVHAGLRTPAVIAVVATVAGLVVVAVAYSPLGRRSGAHLNPAVTFGFWVQRVAGAADLAGYAVAQAAGGLLGVLAARVWGPAVAGPAVHWAVIAPSRPPAEAALIEAVAVAVQLAVVYALLAGHRFEQWAAAAAGALLTVAIVLLAPVSGAGFNPVRGLAPDVAATTYPAAWIYVAGPVAGAAVAALLVRAAGRMPRTGKLFHDSEVVCHMRCELPHQGMESTDGSASVAGDRKLAGARPVGGGAGAAGRASGRRHGS